MADSDKNKADLMKDRRARLVEALSRPPTHLQCQEDGGPNDQFWLDRSDVVENWFQAITDDSLLTVQIKMDPESGEPGFRTYVGLGVHHPHLDPTQNENLTAALTRVIRQLEARTTDPGEVNRYLRRIEATILDIAQVPAEETEPTAEATEF